ncbi:carboxynorspermidine decarboxylase [Rhizobiaceae bacterium]|nr:carboxynorspermidine decarboxylase [Rhizobiaceae bacterium]
MEGATPTSTDATEGLPLHRSQGEPVMATQAGGAGAFAAFDLHRVPSPCFVVDTVAVERNLDILRDVADRSGAKVYLALKAFSMFALAPLVASRLNGVAASGVHEARLGREEYAPAGQGEVATFCAGYKASEIDEIVALSDHVIFNSPAQKARFAANVRARPDVEIGLRINPEHSEGEIAKYDPCAPCSRLGTPVSLLDDATMEDVDGIHMHTLCEQGFEPLARTWAAVEGHLAPWLPGLKWVNLGGGHHITRADYDRDALVAFIRDLRERWNVEVFLEPGEAVALDAGILVGEVLDLPENGVPLAIVDISATCHMPDVIEAPYRPAMLGEVEADASGATTYRFGGPSCLAGDVVGDYATAQPLAVGDRIAFLDQAHYSMVKTNTFNGVPLPSIALWDSRTDELRLVRSFGYDDFRTRLS